MSAATVVSDDISKAGPASHLAPEELWDRHGRALWALTLMLLGDETAALRALTFGLVDLYRQRPDGPSADTAQRSGARCIFERCQDVQTEAARSPGPEAPLVAWVRDVATLQRHMLALCVFGGHTHREAAAALGISADLAATLLRSGLRELAAHPLRSASGHSPSWPQTARRLPAPEVSRAAVSRSMKMTEDRGFC